jgi:hypothetical protein
MSHEPPICRGSALSGASLLSARASNRLVAPPLEEAARCFLRPHMLLECPRYRASMAGEIYASRDEESGRYQVSKTLYADDDVVVARLYTNRFDERRWRCLEGFV